MTTEEKTIKESKRVERDAIALAIYTEYPDIQMWNGDPYSFHEDGAKRGRKRAYKAADLVMEALLTL